MTDSHLVHIIQMTHTILRENLSQSRQLDTFTSILDKQAYRERLMADKTKMNFTISLYNYLVV